MTGETADQTPHTGQLDGEAARWCRIMHGPGAEQHRPAFETWLRRGALHREAYNRIEEVYVLGARLPPHLLAQLPAECRGGTVRGGVRVAIVALAVVALAALPTALWLRRTGAGSEIALLGADVHLRLSTMRTSSEVFRLADGSVVTLGPDSELAVGYDLRARRLRLSRGRSRFDVARERRPFIVDAGTGSVIARGTSFEVAIGEERNVTVSVRSGSVDVQAREADTPGPSIATRRVSAGDEYTYPSAPDAAGPAPDTRGDADQASTVGELVAQANARASGGPTLRLADATLAGVALGGNFHAHQPPIVADRLAVMLNLRVRRARGQIVLERR